MATKVLVNGKFQTRPGVYSTILSGVKNPAVSTSYGNVLIIDDGIGAGFGGGSGVSGTLQNGTNAVYSFNSLQDFQAFVKGGEVWNLAKPLFNPAIGQNGISKLFYVRAATTVPATITVTLTNGAFVIQTKDEGLNANGVLDASTNLSTGYGAKIVKTTSGKYKLQVYHGTYKGLDSVNNAPYDGTLSANAKPQLVVESPEVVAVADLVAWMQTNTAFNAGLTLEAGSTATGAIVDADLVTYPSYILATGGTETYNSADFDAALASINNLDFTHILAMKYGANATGGNNDKLFDFVQNKSKYDRLLVVAAGATKADRATSISDAAYYNSDLVICVHGGVKKTNRNAPNGFSVFSQLYHAAAILGRCAGLPPQVPVTLKSLNIDGEVDILADADQEALIAAGVMYSYFDYELGGLFVIGADVTTLQKNDFLINDNGTTYCWQIKRIEADLNKSIVVNGKRRFFDPLGQGGNRFQSSPEEVVVWLQNYLQSRTASDKKDDLIISYQDVAASINQDTINATYTFVPNSEISKIVFAGTLIEG